MYYVTESLHVMIDAKKLSTLFMAIFFLQLSRQKMNHGGKKAQQIVTFCVLSNTRKYFEINDSMYNKFLVVTDIYDYKMLQSHETTAIRQLVTKNII